MLRILFSIFVMFAFCASVQAAQVGASFSVGIRVVGKGKQKRQTPLSSKSYTWNAAHVTLVRASYGSIRKTKASGQLYWFKAQKRGASYRVAVSRNRGKIVKIIAR